MSEKDSVYFEDSVSLKDVLLQIMTYLKYCLKRFYIILIVGAVFAVVMYLLSEDPIKLYKAEVSFTVNAESAQPSMPNLGGLASTFGFGGGKDSNPASTALAFLKTREVMSRVLFTTATVEEKDDFLINHCIEHLGLREVYAEAAQETDDQIQRSLLQSMSEYSFQNDSTSEFTRKENKIFLTVYKLIINKHLTSGPLEAGMYQITMESESEELSYEFVNAAFKNLDDYYVAQTTEKQKILLEKTEAREDSIKRALASVEYQLANFNDKSSNLIFQTDKSKSSDLKRRVAMLSAMYSEAARNLEMTRYQLQEKTPFIQPVDQPIYPLPSEMTGRSALMSAIIGFIAGALFAIIILCMILFFKLVMADGDPIDV